MRSELQIKNPLVDALRQPGAYPHPVDSVRLVETHVSHLFFAGGFVYKVKKAVNYGFLDFTTLENRRYYCEREIELNSRLSPSVYLGVVPICKHNGLYKIEGFGETVDYAVKMRELPQERALNELLNRNQVSTDEIRRVAFKIADFHRNAATGQGVTKLGDIEAVRQNVEENFEQTAQYVGQSITQEEFDDIAAYSRSFLEAKADIFRLRAEQGRIVDGHGDLHTANVFLEDGIDIIDCIEFNDRFRCLDVAEDVAFLAMDLDHYGRPDLSEAFVSAYVEASGDEGLPDLLNFFESYRAYVRGKVTSFRLDDNSLSEGERSGIESTAREYFHLSHKYATGEIFSAPAIILVAGLMGTGKTHVAQEIARRWNMAHVSTDITRKDLAGVKATEYIGDPYGRGMYSPEFTRLTYDTMYAKAREELDSGRSVVLDGTFRDRNERQHVIQIAREANVELWIVECAASDDEIKRRLMKRAEGTQPTVSDGRWELFQQQKEDWQAIDEVPVKNHIRLDTSRAIQTTLNDLARTLFTRILSN